MARPRPASAVVAVVAIVGLLSFAFTVIWQGGPDALLHRSPVHPGLPHDPLIVNVRPPPSSAEYYTPPVDSWKQKLAQSVNGEPTDKLRDNLRPDTQYVTTWVSGGWTNDFMTYINLVYFGLLTGRTPIIPPFAPSHVAFDAGFPHFGDVFDLPRLSEAVHAPLLEWRHVKRESSSERDELGCWSIWSLVNGGQPRNSLLPDHLKLGISYTAVPSYAERVGGMPDGFWLQFSSLADLSTPARRAHALAQHPTHTGTLPPDEQLMCFDFMYYVGATHHDEWWEDWSPAWRIVGRHAHWAPEIERIARGYVRRALHLSESEDPGADPGSDLDYPLYVGVHVRRGDFTAACGHTAKDECFPPLAAYARRVLEVRGALLAQKGIDVPAHRVLVTSDEADPAWWADVAALGWRRVDHVRERTEARLGKWFAPLVDAVVQSRGVGFVGTDRSTMSLVARRRVEDWQGGIGYLVRIGGRNADD